MKVAIATQDGTNVDGHFASARTFKFFSITKDEAHFLEEMQFETVSAEEGRPQEEGEDRLVRKIEALKGCALLFVTAIGGPAAARVVRANVHPVKLPAPEPISDLCARTQGMLKGNPPPWLRKIIAAEEAGIEL
ncbi:MAG: nitrogen fixation protein NifX [Magnetospirillum sp.]|nr:nitrogen fixation protein NifX [Magnetospirillum sp.]